MGVPNPPRVLPRKKKRKPERSPCTRPELWALSACTANDCDFDGSRVDCAHVLRRPRLLPLVPRPHSVHVSLQKHSPLARQAHLRSTGWTSSSLPLYTMAVSAIRPSFYAWSYEIRPRRLPLGGFPPLWLNQSNSSVRLSMTPQRLGRPRYH